MIVVGIGVLVLVVTNGICGAADCDGIADAGGCCSCCEIIEFEAAIEEFEGFATTNDGGCWVLLVLGV